MSDTRLAKSKGISRWFQRSSSERQLLVQDKEILLNDNRNNTSSVTMSKYGSDAHSTAQFSRSKSHQDGHVISRRRSANSEQISGPVGDDLHDEQVFSTNNDSDSSRRRSYSNNEHLYGTHRKLSDPMGTSRCLDLQRDLSPAWKRPGESLLERSGSRQNGYSRPWRRNQLYISAKPRASGCGGTFYLLEAIDDNDYNIVEEAENELEARRMINNHMFGFHMWMSQVSQSRDTESDLYKSQETILTASTEATLRFSTVLYTVLFGWWLTLLYYVIGCLMYISYFGRQHAKLCFDLGKYFFYPFGKYVYQSNPSSESRLAPRTFGLRTISGTSESLSDNIETTAIDNPALDPTEVVVQPSTSADTNTTPSPDNAAVNGEATEDTPDKKTNADSKSAKPTRNLKHWKTPGMYVWLLLGAPVLMVAHAVVFCLTWFSVITIPIARINGHAISQVLFANPSHIHVGRCGGNDSNIERDENEVILIVHKWINVNFIKYKVDGVNVILVNSLLFVVLAILIGFIDHNNTMVSPIAKCVMGMCAILPVTYYIGMAIACISAQSTFAVGAIMNATFGSVVEVILYIIMLKEGVQKNETCYMELVKSTMTGSILCCILLVPGISMIVGGIKYRCQQFNHNSANISSSLLFVALIGVFAPTIFSKIYGNLTCDVCQTWAKHNSTFGNETGFICSGCKTVTAAPYDDTTLFKSHVMPLMYSCALILFLTYIIGLFFSMKTHSKEIFEEFEQLQKADGAESGHTSAQWSNTKSIVILFLSVLAISLSSDLIADNIAPLLNLGVMSQYFVGISLLSIVGMLPELVNGVLFAMRNNVNLGIEIGSATAIQVGMVQVPIIVIADLIYPLGFGAVFNDIHLYAVIIAVIIITYVFMDGKSDYFQGSIVVAIYALLMAMYFFVVTPDTAVCKSE